MAKASTEKDSNLNVEETSAEVPESIGNSAAVPSTSSEPAETTEHANDESSDKTATDVKAQKVSLKRKVSIMSLESEEEEDEGFIGFSNNCDDPFSCIADIKRIILNLENEITKMTLNVNPLLKVTVECGQRRNDTDTSRPSSSLSVKSDSDGMASSNEAHMLTSARAKKSTELSSPLLRVPFDQGWKRELVYRAALDSHSRKLGDIYYYTPQGKKLRSTREVSEHLAGTGLTLENFSFFKEPLGIDDPEKEIIRGAKLSRRADLTPTPSPTPIILESKRTPKPKAPKGASPEPPKAQSNKIKVKSSGARLTPQPTTPSTPTAAKRRKSMLQQSTTLAENNNTSAKKSSEKRAVRNNGVVNSSISTPMKKRGKQKDDTDNFKVFYEASLKTNYNVINQIFQYLGMRELANCARVCRLWRELVSTPSLWKNVRMKNSQVSDWGALCATLKRYGTKRLDLRKTLLPVNDVEFWDQFTEHISTVTSLERLELCRCPARAVEAVCKGLPDLKCLSAVAVKDNRLDPSALSNMKQLREFKLKSLSGLSLTSDLKPLLDLQFLEHLSLTSIKELGIYAGDLIGLLRQLVSLELGECTFGADFGMELIHLQRLQRLRLERGTADCASPALLEALSKIPSLTQLELVNFDIKIGFDDALSLCRNVQRLLIIPTYVSQSATTNKLVLNGVLSLKETLTHLMWGITIELLRVTELFIDQCDHIQEKKKMEIGECIPVLKPLPGCTLPYPTFAGPPQVNNVEVVPLPSLQKLLSSQLPHTKLKLLRIPFHATWRQSLADFQ